jgi:hypothetical protein
MLTISLTLDSSLLLLQEDLWIFFLMFCFYFLFWSRSSAMCLKAPTACHFAFNVDAGVVVKRLQQQHRSPPRSLARSLARPLIMQPPSCHPCMSIATLPLPWTGFLWRRLWCSQSGDHPQNNLGSRLTFYLFIMFSFGFQYLIIIYNLFIILFKFY